MSSRVRIGIFGGTFDPPHQTHLAIARAARDQAKLDRVLFVISGEPPHKPGDVATAAEDRLAMVAAALNGETGLEPSRVEMERPGPSFTIDTLDELHRQYPDAELFLIIGQDSLLELPRWRRARDILDLARLLVAPRAGLARPVDRALDGRYQMLELPPTAVSSTEIRARLRHGDDPGGCLPHAVFEIIRDRGLYRVDD